MYNFTLFKWEYLIFSLFYSLLLFYRLFYNLLYHLLLRFYSWSFAYLVDLFLPFYLSNIFDMNWSFFWFCLTYSIYFFRHTIFVFFIWASASIFFWIFFSFFLIYFFSLIFIFIIHLSSFISNVWFAVLILFICWYYFSIFIFIFSFNLFGMIGLYFYYI